MSNHEPVGRRALRRSATAAGAAASVPAATAPQPAAARAPAVPASAAPDRLGCLFLHPEEASFVEALADRMVPADKLPPSGTDIGIPAFIDRALGGYGKGDRLHIQGPRLPDPANQGYRRPFTPASTSTSTPTGAGPAGSAGRRWRPADPAAGRSSSARSRLARRAGARRGRKRRPNGTTRPCRFPNPCSSATRCRMLPGPTRPTAPR